MINLTELKTTKKSYIDIESDLLICGFFQGKKLSSQLKRLDMKIGYKLSHAIKLDEFKGKKNTKLSIYGNESIKRILLFGLGTLNQYTTDRVRSIASNITRYSDTLKVVRFTVDGDSIGLQKNVMAQAFVEGLIMGSYRFNEYKSKKDEETRASSVMVCGNVDKKSMEKGMVLGESVCFARDLGNHPANILTPAYLSKEAEKITVDSPNMECHIFDIKELKKMGMGAFYGVARGAKEPAKMIIVEYQGGKKAQKPVALVGKGVTFDSGGISLKPSPKMDEMKFDMCGSATVMGVMRAVSELKPKINIIFAIGSTENMPGGNAQRPGDIVTAYNGKTIEVLNTDAEGRLVLADVLAYVNQHYEPAAILDFATLTGAVLVALGNRASGVMGNDDSLMKAVKKASQLSDEKVWELPLWEEYSREIKGKYADIKNMGENRLAGTIAAGAFLKEFVGKTPWAHLDIAGTAWGPKEPNYQPKVGATGVAVRLVYQFLENR